VETYSYVGDELELFQHATRWKAYYARGLRPFIAGDVLEVGAGLGATSRFLCTGHQRSWTCLEPDPGLHRQLESSLDVNPLACPGRALLGTVASLPSEDRFDTILYVDVLEHIEDDRSELTGSAARLRPGPASDSDRLRNLRYTVGRAGQRHSRLSRIERRRARSGVREDRVGREHTRRIRSRRSRWRQRKIARMVGWDDRSG